MPYDAVVFDLDGTLVDSLADIAATVNQVLAENQLPTYDVPRYRYFVGDGVVTLFDRVLPAELDRAAWTPRCVSRFGEIYEHQWRVATRPYAGIDAMLGALRARNIPLAILSNKPHAFTLQCVETIFGADAFPLVLGQRDSVPRKPDPAGAFEVARHFGVAPERCVYLGDSLVDMQTACRAGMFPVGALWGFRTGDELLAHGAARLIAHPSEFPAIVLD